MTLFSVRGYTVSWPLVGSLIAILIGREIWRLTYFKRRGIKSPSANPLFGNALQIMQSVPGFFLKCQEKFGTVFGVFMFRSPCYVISDPDMIRDITVRGFPNFVNHQSITLKNRPLDKALSNLRDQHWKDVRNVITPTFSGHKMKLMSPLINECVDDLVQNFREVQNRDGEVNICKLYEAFTMDTIARCAFGIQVHSQKNPDDPFVTNAKAIMNANPMQIKLILAGLCPPFAHLLNFLDIGAFPQSVKLFFRDVVKKTMDMRSTNVERKDFLQLMMKAHEDQDEEVVEKKKDKETDLHDLVDKDHDAGVFGSKKTKKVKLTLEELFAQGTLFFAAGYETTNIALTYVTYCLAMNPDVQDQLVREIEEVAPTRESVNYSNVAKMGYLDNIVCETLRLYPPILITDRMCGETYTYNGITIPKGMQVAIGIYITHYNPDIWEDPTRFDPNRFTKENREKRHPFAWIPFGAGPRNCIGMRFALMEVKMAIIRLLQNYRVETCPNTEIPAKIGKTSVKPDNGIVLRVVERS
ncbi:cytochrome P450 3A24-like [Lytechinus pictus]|uniref:cytochrome P450 3A24-like n=1 Tax=Lytechinus pictus TaxID=7653 RepID=UPI0030B9D3E3